MISKIFEEKLFFKVGRQIWNTIGVLGFITTSIGLVLLSTSFIQKEVISKEQFLKNYYRNYEKELKRNPYLKEQNKKEKYKENIQNKRAAILSKIQSRKEIMLAAQCSLDQNTGSVEQRLRIIKGKECDRNSAYEEKIKYYKFKRKMERRLNNLPIIRTSNRGLGDLGYSSKQVEEEQRLKKLIPDRLSKEKLDLEYYALVSENRSENVSRLKRRSKSVFFILFGLGIVAFSSLASAFFSIERNTKKLNK